MIGHNSKPVKDDDMHAAAEFYRTLAEKYKQRRYNATRAKAYKEILLKQIATNNTAAKSFAFAEALASTTTEYKDAVDLHIQADAELEALEMEFKAFEALRGIWQTQSANERGK
jgi:hypothetical protein